MRVSTLLLWPKGQIMARWSGKGVGPGWGQSLKQEGFQLPLRKKETCLEERLWLHSGTGGPFWRWTSRSWHYDSQCYLFLSTADSTFKERPRAKEMKTVCFRTICFGLWCSKYIGSIINTVLKRTQIWGFLNADMIILFSLKKNLWLRAKKWLAQDYTAAQWVKNAYLSFLILNHILLQLWINNSNKNLILYIFIVLMLLHSYLNFINMLLLSLVAPKI